MGRYFKYILLVIFLTALLLIVFLQFNSNRSINQLINGNENLLEELSIKNNLQQLQTDIITLESKVRGTVIGGMAIDSNHLQEELDNIKISLQQLDTLQSENMIAPYIIELNELVNSKINFNKNILDKFTGAGKAAAEELINTQYGKRLTDSIKIKAAQIDNLHQLAVTAIIKEADSNGRKAKTSGTIMALMAAVASIFTFIYIAYKIRLQEQLITKLNISEKKVREAAQIKENFMANMSHEIRTPMNAILGFTNLLKKNNLDQQSAEYLQTIQKSGENLLTIINDILDLSKIEAGMMRIESAPFSIRSLLLDVEDMFKERADKKQLHISMRVNDSLPDNLEGDAFRLTQILVNLVGNAFKFTSKGSITVKISNEGVTDNKIKAGITVSDTGIGIVKEKLATIFNRFQQAEDAVTRKYGGTGLGLSIVKDLVILQQGSINVESEPGKGTTFHITVCVLVVEDNEMNQSLIKHLFKNWKLDFDLASNGIEAISKLKNKKYNLILMDIQMPEMDGYTATQEIRNNLKLAIPIIAMTAHALTGEKEKCLGYGMDDYISKPIREEELHSLITKFTAINQNAVQKNITADKSPDAYRYINLKYMKEISNGNTEYEKTVTGQFIEAIPVEIKLLEDSFRINDLTILRQTAHNLKTTISIMGLDDNVQACLDALEYENLDNLELQQKIDTVKVICNKALAEATLFLATF
jgi:signal transduction histidine kinase/DNA-binding response OmpR family regulator